MKRKKKRITSRTTFTKLWMNRLLWFCCLWITCSYLLAARGYTEIAQALSQTACATIIGTMIPYFLKSFFETREEKKNEQDQMKKQFHCQNDIQNSLQNKGFSQPDFKDNVVNNENDVVG